MRLTQLVIRNFRGLERIEVAFDNRVNVIVGPNAVGKTTVLEAIRLAKALLAPRSQNEAGQTLQSLRIAVPHYPQRIFPGAVARDAAKSIEIRCRYEFGEIELGRLDGGVPQIATGLVLAGLGRAFGNSAENIPFLSSPQGLQMLSGAESQLRQALSDFRDKKGVQPGCCYRPFREIRRWRPRQFRDVLVLGCDPSTERDDLQLLPSRPRSAFRRAPGAARYRRRVSAD